MRGDAAAPGRLRDFLFAQPDFSAATSITWRRRAVSSAELRIEAPVVFRHAFRC